MIYIERGENINTEVITLYLKAEKKRVADQKRFEEAQRKIKKRNITIEKGKLET